MEMEYKLIRIGICDDIYDARMQLRSMLERILERKGIQCNCVEFPSGEKLLRFLETHTGEMDVLFLDMKMMGIDGLETARRIRKNDADVELVFVTSYADRVFDGYTVGALAYLMKPAGQKPLEEIINKVLSGIYQKENQNFFCRYGEVTYRIPYNKILYFVSDRRRIICVTSEREISFYDKLDHVAEQVGGQFVRIHQRYLVNACNVDSFCANEVHIGDIVLPVSRSLKESAMIAFTHMALGDL